MELEQELQRLLHSRDVPAHVADPVAAVHAGMRRRRRTQRLQVLSAGLGVLVIALGALLAVGNPLAGVGPQTQQPATSSVSPPPAAVPVPTGFQLRDLSFVSANRGWALGVVPCATGECRALLATDDGGATWEVRQVPPASQPTSIRFVRTDSGDEIGYAFNPGLAVTTDGGRTWTDQHVNGKVEALEAANGNVIRVLIPQGACPGCTFVVQRSTVGGTTWEDVARPTFDRGVSASLVRQRNRLVVLMRGHTSGGASDARSRLLFSTDNGTSWSAEVTDPCGPMSAADEVDATQVALAAKDAVVVLCQHRGPVVSTFVRVSADAGKTFGPGRPVPGRYTALLLAASRDSLIVSVIEQGSTTTHLLRSTDDGSSWVPVASQSSPSGISTFLGFTTPDIGTWVGPNTARLWRTADSGATWAERPLH
jgi:photosystem II stability/assembly factor-like uncharacterized protein